MDPAADQAAAAASAAAANAAGGDTTAQGGLPPGATDATKPADGQTPPGQTPPGQQPATPPTTPASGQTGTPPTFVKVQGDLLARARAMVMEKPTAPITQEAFFKKIVEDGGSDANWKTYYTPKGPTETGLVDTGSVLTFIDSRVPGSKRYMVAVISRGCGSGSESTSDSSEEWSYTREDEGDAPFADNGPNNREPLPGWEQPAEQPAEGDKPGFSASISKGSEGWKVGAKINFLATKSQVKAKAKAPGGAYRFLMLVDGFPALTKCTTADEAVKYLDGANVVKLATVYVDKNSSGSSFGASVSLDDDEDEQ